MRDSDPRALFEHVIRRLDEERNGYLHLIEPRASFAGETDEEFAAKSTRAFREIFGGALISAGEHTLESAEECLREGWADAVAFG